MHKAIIFSIFFICTAMMLNTYANPVLIPEKYKIYLLTNNYEILNQNDFKKYNTNLKPRFFTAEKPSGAYIYWQCFPRDHIAIILKDTGFSSDDFGWKDNIADLKIIITAKPKVIHEYNIRKRMTVTDFERIFNKWRAIMKNEKYVCLAGSFISREQTTLHNKNIEKSRWVFEALKTKKGCDSDLYSCK